MNEQTKKALVETGLVTFDQIKKAESGGSDFILELMAAANLSEQQLSDGLARVYRMPYVSLKGRKMAPGANLAISADCIRRWRIFPVHYVPKDGLMTIAVSGPEQAERTERIFQFLMESFDIGYVFTGEKELIESLERECPEGTGGVKQPAVALHEKQKISLPSQAGSTGGRTKIAIPLPKSDANARKSESPAGQPAGLGRPVSSRPAQADTLSDELIKSLTSAVSMLVNAHLGSDKDKLEMVKARVRYCQLTATRLALTPLQATKVILAAWLSALADRKDLIRQFVCPYDLEEVIFAEESGRGLGIESLILTLVKSYQDLERESPEEAKDVNMARRGLFMNWVSASKHQDVLETFLQVLMDEQFVNKLGKHAGRVLLVSEQGGDIADVQAVIERSGYAVKGVSTLDEVEADIRGNGVDLLVVGASGEGAAALKMCRILKESSVSAGVPLMAVISEGAAVKGTEFLRAGADDFVAAPIDVELLLLKAEKLLVMPAKREDRAGVSGSLADMSFSDLVQILSAGGKSMDVSVTNGNENGRIVLREGNVVHAEAGDVTGENAFYALMQWKVGQFSMSECQDFPAATVTSSTMSLLMEGARLADEGAAG